MCGRFLINASRKDLAVHFGLYDLADTPVVVERYNVAPTQNVLAVRGVDGKRELVAMRWGLVPSWAADLKAGAKHINARAETVAEKPSYRTAFQKRRCLIPASGFYEWKAAGKHKQPYAVRPEGGGLLAFAGLWEHWDKGEEPVESCAIITTAANKTMEDLHDRMPVILRPDDYAAWLDPSAKPADLLGLLTPFAGGLERVPVSTRVNNPWNDDPECLKPPA